MDEDEGTNTATMRSSSCKQKGRKHQQKIRRDLLDAFATLQEDDIRSVSMGASGEDILMSPAAQDAIPFSFEAKCVERLNIYAALEQARSNCPLTRVPAVVFRKNHFDAHVAIPWETFLELLHSAWCHRQRSETSSSTLSAPPSGQEGVNPTTAFSYTPAPQDIGVPETLTECHNTIASLRARVGKQDQTISAVRDALSRDDA